MAWQDINLGEVDTNSPITTTLMTKIREDLNYLFSKFCNAVLFNSCGIAESALQGLDEYSWATVKTIKVYIPPFAKTLKIRMKGRICNDEWDINNLKWRAEVGGVYSDEFSTNSESEQEFTLTINNPPSGINDINFQAYCGSDFYYITYAVWYWAIVYISEAK